jgi:hypothetical protein
MHHYPQQQSRMPDIMLPTTSALGIPPLLIGVGGCGCRCNNLLRTVPCVPIQACSPKWL